MAALLKAYNPALEWKALRNLLLTGGVDIPDLANFTVTGKRLDAYGSLTCSDSVVLSRLQPVVSAIRGKVGTPVPLAALNVNCALPNGNVDVTVQPDAATVTLLDDGTAPDQEAGDGIYSGQWAPTTTTYTTLNFPAGDQVIVYFSAFAGKVKNGDGKPQPGATVAAYQDGVVKHSTRTDAAGRYTLAVAEGTYDLVASHEDALVVTKSGMTVGTEETVKGMNFKLYHPGAVSGYVWDRVAQTKLAGALVVATHSDGTVVSATTNQNGYYRLVLLAGSYHLRASISGYKKATKDMTVHDGADWLSHDFYLWPR